MMRRRYFLHGLYVASASFACIAIILLVQIGASYDGECGGLLPALAGSRVCSFSEYVLGNLLLFALLLATEYWPLALALLFVPPFAGYLLDRLARDDAA